MSKKINQENLSNQSQIATLIASEASENLLQKYSTLAFKKTIYAIAELFAMYLGLIGTESAYSIWHEIFTSTLDEYFDPSIKIARLKEEDLGHQIWLKFQRKKNFKVFIKKLVDLEFYCIKHLKESKSKIEQIRSKTKVYLDLGPSDVDNNGVINLFRIWMSRNYNTIVFGLMTSFFIGYHFYYLSNLKIFYENYLAELQHKFPKLKYLGKTGKKLRKFLPSFVDEIQIGLSKSQLKNFAINTVQNPIFIDTQVPEIYYNKKQLLTLKPVLKSLIYPKIIKTRIYKKIF